MSGKANHNAEKKKRDKWNKQHPGGRKAYSNARKGRHRHVKKES